VELTLVPGASVALVARAHGVNANQVFKWRREYELGELPQGSPPSSLLPVVLSGCDSPLTTSASIHIELPGRVLISIEGGADPTLLRCILESLRK
jgi:transposase